MKKKMIPLTSDILNIISEFTVIELENYNLPQIVHTAFMNSISSYFNNYSSLGCHVIGLWNYDETQEYPDFEIAIQAIISDKINRIYPYLKVLSNEFIGITGKEIESSDYIDNGNKTNSNLRNKQENASISDEITRNDTNSRSRNLADTNDESKTNIGNKNRSKSESDNNSEFISGNSTVRSAHEESPITSAPITSAPSASSTWNLSPSSKDGAQNDSSSTKSTTIANAGTEAEDYNESGNISNIGSVSDSESENRAEISNKNESKANTESNAESMLENVENTGHKSKELENPEMMLKILKFNVNDLNVTRIARKYVSYFIEELNTVY